MKLLKTAPLACTMALVASTASADGVVDSFDGLVDDVLASANASFFSGAVNTAAIDASVDISAGGDLPAGELTVTYGTAVTLDNFSATGDDVLGTGLSALSGGFDDTGNSDTNGGATYLDGIEATLKSETISQNFGDVTTVAAGAINESTMTLTETGAIASASAKDIAGSASVDINSSNTVGSQVGALTGALNTASIDGSVNIDMVNASGGGASIGTTAAGAINTSELTATFVGGGAAEANADLSPKFEPYD